MVRVDFTGSSGQVQERQVAPTPVDFSEWFEHFRDNPGRQAVWDDAIDWTVSCELDPATRRAFVVSLQRFELGENGDGVHLLAKADRAGDPVYSAALRLLVVEEQRHSALFGRAVDHLGGDHLSSHWTDAVFTALRRALGLRTEIGLFLVDEAVAMDYFLALADGAPDPVLRGVGARIAYDEKDHLGFQIDRLAAGFAGEPAWRRLLAAVGLTVVAAGAATVLVAGHRAALRACGRRPVRYWWGAMTRFRGCLRQIGTQLRALDTVSSAAPSS